MGVHRRAFLAIGHARGRDRFDTSAGIGAASAELRIPVGTIFIGLVLAVSSIGANTVALEADLSDVWSLSVR